jgi:hypothetical protein
LVNTSTFGIEDIHIEPENLFKLYTQYFTSLHENQIQKELQFFQDMIAKNDKRAVTLVNECMTHAMSCFKAPTCSPSPKPRGKSPMGRAMAQEDTLISAIIGAQASNPTLPSQVSKFASPLKQVSPKTYMKETYEENNLTKT